MDVDDLTIRQTVTAIRDLLRLPNNTAAQTKARLLADTLEMYLPEKLEEEKRTLEAFTRVLRP